MFIFVKSFTICCHFFLSEAHVSLKVCEVCSCGHAFPVLLRVLPRRRAADVLPRGGDDKAQKPSRALLRLLALFEVSWTHSPGRGGGPTTCALTATPCVWGVLTPQNELLCPMLTRAESWNLAVLVRVSVYVGVGLLCGWGPACFSYLHLLKRVTLHFSLNTSLFI